MLRMEDEGHRVMAAAFRDLDPATFDPAGDLLGHVTDLELTSLVAMVDPPRDESKAAVPDAQNAHIRVRMVTGDDVTTGAAIAKQLGIPGTAMLGTDFAALASRNGWPASTTSAWSAGSHPSTRCCWSRRFGRRARSSR